MAIIKNISDYMESSGIDDTAKTVSNNLYGFNHTRQLPIIQQNKDYNGYTFFTRPQLNLTDANLANISTMYKFLNNNSLSAQRFARVTLDPRLHYDNDHEFYNQKSLHTPLVDARNPFIPLLSNTLETLSGWPDVTVPHFTSSSGLRKEQWAMVDGVYEIFDVFTLNATFNNFVTEPLSLLLELWNRVPALVFEGMMNKYIDFIIANEFDYNTRIYRLITDESGRYIKKSAATGASFINTEPTAKFFDFNRTTPYNEQTKMINVNFVSMGAIYNDDAILLDFNRASSSFNPMVTEYLQYGIKANSYIDKIPYELLPAFSNRGYPVIDLETNELIWLIDKSSKSYKKIMSILKDNHETKIYV